MTESAVNTTITILPVSLSIVHIPRSRIQSLCHPILRQLLLPRPPFLNITCNELELSLFAEDQSVYDFESIAQSDARKLRVRGRSKRSTPPSSSSSTNTQSKLPSKPEWEPIEISPEKWTALQIDSHSSCQDNSGARVHELSAPLAAAGISILYQSSYMSDFIFVKEHRKDEVLSLLRTAGFRHQGSDPYSLFSNFNSPMNSPPANAVDDKSSIHYFDLNGNAEKEREREREFTVLSRSRSSTDAAASASVSASITRFATSSPETSSSVPGERRDPSAFSPSDDSTANGFPSSSSVSTANRPVMNRSQSHSPSACDVRILESDLTCVGLHEDSTDQWMTKIIKLFAYPELISGSSSFSSTATSTSTSSGSDDASSRHRSSSVTSNEPPRPLRTLSPEPELNDLDEDLGLRLRTLDLSESEGNMSDQSCSTHVGPPSSSSTSGVKVKRRLSITRVPSESPILDLEQRRRPWDEDSGDGEDESEEDGSGSGESGSGEEEESDEVYLSAGTDERPRSSPRSGLGFEKETRRRPPLPHLDTITPKTRTDLPSDLSSNARQSSSSPSISISPTSSSPTSSYSSSSSFTPSTHPQDPIIPFFSFTRTSEGSSLTASVHLLASLFPRSERHMVMCSGELDVLDDVREAEDGFEVIEREDIASEDGDGEGDGLEEPLGPVRCLQIDLRKFGLDKHGLVSRFSRTLEENGINHMYSSTYKTANLLVDKAHANRAQSLLRAC